MPEMIQRSSFTSAHSLTAGATSPRLTSILPNENDDPHIPDSIPPWVHLTTDNHTSIPEPIRPNTRHWKPPPPANYRPGKKWDHLRSAEPPLLSLPIEERQIAWKPFMGSGPNMRYEADTENARLMSSGWVEENMPVTQRQWEKHDEMAVDKSEDADGYWFLWFLSPERRDRTTRVFWRLLLRNPFIPLIFRVIVLSFSAAALGIAATIYQAVQGANTDADPSNNCATRASTYIALVVGSVAVPYIGYVTWDEYTAKPLGIRSAFAKTSLLLVDVYFIIAAASNLSLAFDALYDHRWACYDDLYQLGNQVEIYEFPGVCPNNPGICYKQKALTSVLFLSLIAWLITFSISVMRVVEKLRV